MIPEIGLLCLILAFAVACVQAAGVQTANIHLPRLQCWLIFAALLALIYCRVESDFTVANVADHSNRSLPLMYKITGAWGNHEGSMIVVVLVLALYGALLAGSGGHPAARVAVAAQGALSAAFLLFIIATSNPFARLFPPPEDGAALNPLLQDVGLIVHPPLLYLGYMGFSVVFTLAVGALAQGRMEREWARLAHPWILAAWSFLTLGIALGSWWAYRELGWGGFWFWDPVENASLLPWLSGTALLHANAALLRRGVLKHWVLLLSLLTFAMSLLGTFLVRSGIVTSVHSFASDPARGVFILAFFALFGGGALALYAVRAGRIASETTARPLSREGLLVVNGLVFIAALGVVLLGTLYPLLSELLWEQSLTVGPPYFHRTFLPVMALAILLAAAAPLAAWERDTPLRLLKCLRPAFVAAAAAALLVLALAERAALIAAMGFLLAAWLAAGTLSYARRARGLRGLSTVLAHLGAAALVAGITGMGAWQSSAQKVMRAGDTLTLNGETLTLKEVIGERRDNHVSKIARLEAGDYTLLPEFRMYDIVNSVTSEAAIRNRWWGDTYAVAGEAPGAEGLAVRAYHNPLVHLLWLGALLMAAGGFVGAVRKRKEQA